MLTGIVWEKEKSTVLDVLQIQKTSFLKTWLCQLFIAACTLLVVARGIQSSIRQGSNPGPLYWKNGVLATEPLGKSLKRLFITEMTSIPIGNKKNSLGPRPRNFSHMYCILSQDSFLPCFLNSCPKQSTPMELISAFMSYSLNFKCLLCPCIWKASTQIMKLREEKQKLWKKSILDNDFLVGIAHRKITNPPHKRIWI